MENEEYSVDGLICDGRGWYKTYRQIIDWEWYRTPHMFHLFSHLLSKANYEEKRWQGVSVKRGQCITSLNHLSVETGISRQSIRTCLDRLKSTHEITLQSTHNYTLITITKYDTYQSGVEIANTVINTPVNTRLTQHQHSPNTNEEVKNKRNIYIPLFDEFWKAYPNRNGKKVGKKECMDYFIQSFTNGDRQLVIKASFNYANSKTAKDGFAKDPIRFLKKEFWKDWIDAPNKKNEGDWV